ncbi:MAG: exonuclease domain-containing protein [Chloroflexota bacterium]|nr:exonuclease domain-containing protein [Chloroflexota bacterium]MDE2918248.1 exonuclease domain-containing protein [Chloroflexota bacterium]
MNLEAAASNSDAPARRSVLVEAAVTTLEEAGRPMTLQQLARAVLHVEAGGAHIGARILAPLLEGDDRLATVAAGHWGLAAWSQRSDAIDETEFVVFDIETNGGRGGRHRVLEVGALRLRAGREISCYASLVRVPGRVSKFVTRYTGITDEMLVDAPPVETVLDEFREFQSGGVLVAHNLPTDLGYLNREAVWAGRALFPGDGLDTMELSATLLPDLPGTGLATVLETAGISDTPTHRALDDAGVTAQLFQFLLGKAADREAQTLEDLRRLAARGGPESRHPRRARELARWASRNLPPSPGVYIFRDTAGRPLYVGKSTSLQRRVRSHFTDSAGFVRRRDGMLEQIDAIEWEPTGSELRALVREAELIIALSPTYNRNRRWRIGRRLVRVGPAESAATHAAAVPRDDGADYLGPFPTSRDARLASEAARRIFELPSRRSADKQVPAWRRDAAVAFLGMSREAALRIVHVAEAGASEREALARRIRRVRVLRHPVRGGLGAAPMLAITAGTTPGDAELVRIENGAIAAIESISRPRRPTVRAALQRLGSATPPGSREDDYERHIVLAWLHAHADDPDAMAWDPDLSRAFVDRVWRRVRQAASAG